MEPPPGHHAVHGSFLTPSCPVPQLAPPHQDLCPCCSLVPHPQVAYFLLLSMSPVRRRASCQAPRRRPGSASTASGRAVTAFCPANLYGEWPNSTLALRLRHSTCPGPECLARPVMLAYFSAPPSSAHGNPRFPALRGVCLGPSCHRWRQCELFSIGVWFRRSMSAKQQNEPTRRGRILLVHGTNEDR